MGSFSEGGLGSESVSGGLGGGDWKCFPPCGLWVVEWTKIKKEKTLLRQVLKDYCSWTSSSFLFNLNETPTTIEVSE